MSSFLFSKRECEKSIVYKKLKHKKKKAITLSYDNFSLLKIFKISLIGDSCELLLEAE